MKNIIKVAAVIFNGKNEILLIKERYAKENSFKWNLIKGTYDNANETMTECIQREIKEEVGLNVENLKLRKIFHYGDAAEPKILFVFSARSVGGDVVIPSKKEQATRNENIEASQWFTLEEIKIIKKEDFIAPYVYLSLKNIGQQSDTVEIVRI